ncbi:MAG: PEP/pyruvate-binding domain-containing protein [Verrucomicrobiales bacterium]
MPSSRLRTFVFAISVALLTAFVAAIPTRAEPGELTIELLPDSGPRWARLHAPPLPDSLLALEASLDLQGWLPIATLHDGAFGYPDAASAGFGHRFYRMRSRPRIPADDWKNQIAFADEAFRSVEGAISNEVRWVKFAILTSDPTRVFYQDSAKYLFHYDFAHNRLDPFRAMDRVTFDSVSLHAANQQVVLGAVLYPPRDNTPEYGIQLAGLDPYPPEVVAGWLDLVSATIHGTPGTRPLYLPAWEQLDLATLHQDFFAQRGYSVASTDRWLGGNSVYAAGWTLGRLVYLPAAEIMAAYGDGRLRPQDVLLTDGVPAETPLVAAIISLRPSTPNSHIAILSRSFGIPFIYLPDEGERQRVLQWSGREVVVRADDTFDGGTAKVVDVEGALTPELRSEILALKTAPLLNFPAKTPFGAFSASTQDLVPADARFFGGKAANYGLLRRKIPNNSPPAIAFSFDLWDQFLDQTLPSSKTLRQEIYERLASHTTYPPNIAALRTDLAAIRNLFTTTAQFTEPQQEAIKNALSLFDPSKNIRFRSSTNLEDGERFTGAGLYDSYSGCILDDLDGDTTGPSACDPTEADERGVFRAIKKVYASFYNENAYLERLRHSVNESQAGMALLVHHSFPDEAANGVATMEVTSYSFSTSYQADLVTQLGEVSVTNPDGTALPELVEGYQSGSGASVTLKERSTLVPLGGHVMTWEGDYLTLMNLLTAVADGYRELYPERTRLLLDFEYKKEGAAIVVKQVRPLPLPPSANAVVPFLINEPINYRIFQGEFGDVFANHRLKSRWAMQTRSMRLTAQNLAQSFHAQSHVEFLDGTTVSSLDGPLSQWPLASYAYGDGTARDLWTLGTGAEQRVFELETLVTTEVREPQSPVLTQTDFGKVLKVTYARPMPTFSDLGEPATTSEEFARLVPESGITPTSLLQRREVTTQSGMAIEASFYWPESPKGVVAGYTAPLVQWVETKITGLTTVPIVLRGYFSQTYRPGHHNFTESFIFEPQLEEGISPQVISALAAANIKLLHWEWRGSEGSTVTRLGLDGKFTVVP